jgi:phospholipase/carboxylesterase
LKRERNQLLSKNKLSLTHLVREPGRKESTSASHQPPLLLLLHGIGSNEADLFGLSPYLDARLVMGPGSYGWFNIELTPQGMVADLEQAKESLLILPKFIDELIETYHVDAGCVYLMGFSQGAMMTLAHAINHPEKIGGAVVMSGRYPSHVLEEERDSQALQAKPFLVTHGIYDPVLPIEEGRLVRKNLEALPVKLVYREYPMGHEVSMESLRDVSAWLTSSLDECLTKLP